MDIKQEIPFQIPTAEILIGRSLSTSLCNYITKFNKPLVICDENTSGFLKINAETIILPTNVKPSVSEAKKIPQGFDLYIAIGSGTINDIVKYAAYLNGAPYIIFGTAASMNGYASGGASLLDGGYKKSFTAAPPQAIYLDLDIIETAPRRLTNAGIGDSLCRQLTENDAILANLTRGDDDHHALFRLMEKYEDLILDDIESLCKTLIFGGVAMYVAGSSAPASGAEHMIAHYMELMQPDAPHSLHGEQIAVCSVAMAKLQEEIITSGQFHFREFDTDSIRHHFAATGMADYFITETTKKFNSFDSIHIDHAHFDAPNAEILEEKFKSIGAPTTPQEIGWNPEIFNNALKFASFTRNRVTFLDLIKN